MYNFTDTTAGAVSTSLPTEAVKINGSYIENLISGYQTLYVKGRESLAKEIVTYGDTKADGSLQNYSRFPSRTLTVGFQLIRESASDFMDACNALATLLNVEDAEIIIADEPDKYYIGCPVMSGEVEEGRYKIKSEYTIFCADPFKYATTETGPISLSTAYDTTEADEYDTTMTYNIGDMVKHSDGTTMKLYECNTDGTTGTWNASKWNTVTGMAFTVNNDGGYKTYPRFVAHFAEDVTSGVVGTDGNSGFIQFAKVVGEETQRRIQFGDDEDLLAVEGNGFDIDFTQSTLGNFTNASGTTILNFTDTANASASTSGVKPSYGTATGWHGALITKTVSAAADFKLDFSQLLYLTNKKQMFGFMALCMDSSNNIIAGVRYTKSNKTALTGNIDYIIGGSVKKTAKNQKFEKTSAYGYTKKTKTASSKIRNGNSYIKRSGGTIAIKLAGDSKVSYFYPSSIPTITKVGFFFVKNGSNSNPAANYLRSAKFTAASTENAFNSGCTLEVDCNDASVILDAIMAPNLGDVGNEWSDFYLDVGNNTIFVAWSDWTVSAPTLEMYYTKRWL